jgi:hypothetical protein
MNLGKTVIGGVAAGVAVTATEFVLHGQVMAATYMKYPDVFEQEQANPLHFILVAVCIGVASAMLFGRTRGSWAEGWKGGATFGAFIGLIAFFSAFYRPLVFAGFPYHLAWCQGGINLIAMVLAGSVLGLVIKRA